MSYRDETFYNLRDNDGVGPYMGNHSSNAKFVHPSPNIRFLAAEDQLNALRINKDPKNPTYVANPYTIQRGYIRGLKQPGIPGGAQFNPLKCSFQFNPQQITQVVAMREDVYLPILQDPIQFTQPFGAMTNFTFDLLFDRSREVADASYYDETGGHQFLGTIDQTNLENLNYKKDVAQIGAVADLRLLYSIIGQGFSQETLKMAAARLRQSAIHKANEGGGTDTTDPNAITTANVDEKVGAYINDSNVGNSAFLIPNPVRVIFSSLFMVDGFITGTSVDFLKFNTNMVPLQIRVGLTMNAMYIGFAREKTFLTEQLEKQGEELKRQAAEDGAADRETQQLADTVLDKFGYITYHYATPGKPNLIGNIQTLVTSGEQGNSQGDPLGDVGSPIYRWIFKNGNPLGSVETNVDWGKGIEFGFVPKTFDVEAFSKMLETNQISFNWSLKIYGPFDTKADADKVRRATGTGYGSTITGRYNGTVTYPSSYKGYNEYIQGDSTLKNGSDKAYIHTSSTSYSGLHTKWFATKFNVTVNVNTSGPNGTPINKTATAEVWRVLQGWQCSTGLFQLPWVPKRGTNNLS